MKFRKKPVVIDAWQLNLADDENVLELYNKIYDLNLELNAHSLSDIIVRSLLSKIREYSGIPIPTLEGVLLATDGDWIIQGADGKFYSCEPDIFEKTYEAVDGIS